MHVKTNERGPRLHEWYVVDGDDRHVAESSLYYPNEAEALLAAEKCARGMIECLEAWKSEHHARTPTKGLTGA